MFLCSSSDKKSFGLDARFCKSEKLHWVKLKEKKEMCLNQYFKSFISKHQSAFCHHQPNFVSRTADGIRGAKFFQNEVNCCILMARSQWLKCYLQLSRGTHFFFPPQRSGRNNTSRTRCRLDHHGAAAGNGNELHLPSETAHKTGWL